MTEIQVVWASAAQWAAGLGKDSVTTKTIDYYTDGVPDEAVCEKVFRDTNLYEGDLWDALQPLSDRRTHTAISVGDYITIDGRMYCCGKMGWIRTDTFDPGLGFAEPTEKEVDL
jgi:hypothetical protein